MFYFSPILGKAIKDGKGEHIGRVADMIMNPKDQFPRIVEIIQKYRGKRFRIPWEQVKHIDHEGLILKGAVQDFNEFESNGNVLLKRDILDKQIVDINGHRVIRVNDIQLNMLGKDLLLAGIDAGTPGLLRRLGILGAVERISKMLNMAKAPTNIISWDSVQYLGESGSAIKLTTTWKKLTKLHPADLADILEELTGDQRMRLFGTLDTETAAETLEHMVEDAQLALFSQLDDEKASDILEEMSPDEAADLLQDLPRYRVKELLGLMEPEEAEDVKELLIYEEDTAGGLMSNEFVSAKKRMTCLETMELIRELEPEAETIYYVYVVNEEDQLEGVVSLRDIIVHKPGALLEEFMSEEPYSVRDKDGINEVVDLITKYDLLAVPVVDDKNIIKGIVTFDDVMDLLIPEEIRSPFA